MAVLSRDLQTKEGLPVINTRFRNAIANTLSYIGGIASCRLSNAMFRNFLNNRGQDSEHRLFIPRSPMPGFFLLDGLHLGSQILIEPGNNPRTVAEIMARGVHGEYEAAGYTSLNGTQVEGAWNSYLDVLPGLQNGNAQDIFVQFARNPRLSEDGRYIITDSQIAGGLRLIIEQGMQYTPTGNEVIPDFRTLILRQGREGVVKEGLLSAFSKCDADSIATTTQMKYLSQNFPDVVDILINGAGNFVGLNGFGALELDHSEILDILLSNYIADATKFFRFRNHGSTREDFYRGVISGIPFLRQLTEVSDVKAMVFVTKTGNATGSPLKSIIKFLSRLKTGKGILLPVCPSDFGKGLKQSLPGFSHGSNQGPSVFGIYFPSARK